METLFNVLIVLLSFFGLLYICGLGGVFPALFTFFLVCFLVVAGLRAVLKLLEVW